MVKDPILEENETEDDSPEDGNHEDPGDGNQDPGDQHDKPSLSSQLNILGLKVRGTISENGKKY